MPAQLRLDATVVDKFSKPLGELRAKMQAVTRTGAAGTKATSAEFSRFHTNVARVTQSLRGGLEPSLAAVGLKGLGAGLALGGVAGAIAGVVASIRKFSSSAIEMRNLSRETGIAISTIQQLKSVSDQFGAKSESIASGLEKFRANIFDAKIGKGIIGDLSIRKGGDELIRAMQGASPEEALNKALEFLAQQKDPERQKRLSNLIFGTDDFAKLVQDGMPALNKARADAAARQPLISDEDLRKSREYQAQIANITDRLAQIPHLIGSITIPWLSGLLDGLDRAVEKGKELAKELAPKLSEATENLASGKAAESAGKNAKSIYEKRGIVGVLQELFGFGPAEGAEDKSLSQKSRPPPEEPRSGVSKDESDGGATAFETGSKPGAGQGKPGGSLPGPGLFKFRDEIREGTKQGFIEALRQMMRERVPGDVWGARVWNASYGGGGGYSAVQEGLRRHGGVGGGYGGGGGRLSNNSTPGWWTAERQQHAFDVLTKGGLSQESARGLISRWVNVEAPGGPGAANNIAGGHFGIAQWSRSRGKAIWGNQDFDAQLQHVIKEANSKEEAVAGALLKSAKTPEEGALAATAYERAEHYNPQTHIDDWTAKTLRGMSRLPLGKVKESLDKARENAQFVIPGQTDPHKPGFDYKAVPAHDYFPDRAAANRPGAALRAQAASPWGLSGPMSGARTGKATLEVSLKGVPPVNTKADGGSLFDKIEVRRGRSMQQAKD